jgi:hypothetical protein
VVFGQARGGSVIHRYPVFAQHQTVADLAHGEFAKGVGVDAVEEFGGIGALHVDLAKRGHIADAHGFARRQNLSVDRLAPVGLPGARQPLGA